MYEDRVAKGAKLLDRVRPGWADKIAQHRIDMNLCSMCILGQLWGSFYMALKKLWKEEGDETELQREAQSYGFMLLYDSDIARETDDSDMEAVFLPLADAWRTEINRRLSGSDRERAVAP